MARFLLHDFWRSQRKGGRYVLAFSWFLGLLCGYGLFLHADTSVFPLMRAAASSRVTIAGLVNVTLLPFLLSAFAVFLSQHHLLPLFAWGKAFSFAFISLCAMASFGSAGWLAYPLLMFSDVCTMPVLWLYWLRHISGERAYSFRGMVPYLAAASLIGSVDYCLISPFLAIL